MRRLLGAEERLLFARVILDNDPEKSLVVIVEIADEFAVGALQLLLGDSAGAGSVIRLDTIIVDDWLAGGDTNVGED